MKLTQMKKAALVLAVLVASTSAHAYGKKENHERNKAQQRSAAISACTSKVMHKGHGQYWGFSNREAVDKGHNNYKVTGTLESKSTKGQHHFSCNVRHGEVVRWRVRKPHGSGNSNNAAAVGAGILAIAAIAAAANNDKHENHAHGASAFDDMRYLKRQCKQNIRRHISHDDQAVKSIHLDTAHLHNRTLVGNGGVIFRRGGGADISYKCKFDRRGQIYDGHYRFY